VVCGPYNNAIHFLYQVLALAYSRDNLLLFTDRSIEQFYLNILRSVDFGLVVRIGYNWCPLIQVCVFSRP